MAKLDQVLLKTSTLTEEALKACLRGDTGETGDKIEAGELVIRREQGRIELWALDIQNEPQQVSVEVEGIIPPWDPSNIKQCSLGDLSDVDYADGNPGGLGPSEAGYCLTWDGEKWVVREQIAAQISDGIIPSLNLIGDVNYSLYSGPPQNKYQPEQYDVLWWDYDYAQSKYVWGPVAFKPENLQNVWIPAQSNNLVFQYSGLYLTTESGLASPCTLVNNVYQLEHQANPVWSIDKSITLKWARPKGSAADDLEPVHGIRIHEDNYTDILPNGYYYTTLFHVQDDWVKHPIGDLANVNEAGVLQGQVLAWDALSLTWRPSSGVAPDLSQGSVGDLKDVEIDQPKIRQALVYSAADKWENQYIEQGELIPYYRTSREAFDNEMVFFEDQYNESFNYDIQCKKCTEELIGSYATIDNLPHICLKTRSNTNAGSNNTYGWIQILTDGFNRNDITGAYPPAEESVATSRKEVLQTVAYAGQLGSLNNVSTAGAESGSTIVYDGRYGLFQIGFPNIFLGDYLLEELADVCPAAASPGYGLIWNGECWAAAPIDQKIRMNDLVDVQFGTTGVQNTKLVAAYMLVDGEQTDYKAYTDLSPTLAVSTPKQDAGLGSTLVANSPEGFLYQKCRYFWRDPKWSIAQKLDNYVRWDHDPSWQTIQGDGCIEVYFYVTQLLETRTIFRKEATVSAAGGYVLRVGSDGSFYFGVSGSTGNTGFAISLPFNSISINNWHHVACTKERNINRLYLDGEKVGEAISAAPWTGDGKMALGRNDLDDNNTLTHHFFEGAMLDFRVTNGRAKYTGETYTQPNSLENELVDTTPNSGDFLQFNGSYWTNVKGVEGDISNKSITELADVDTTSNNPEQGDALVWTGQQWEPGIPGIGATWSLDDMTDVSTCYQCARPSISFDQAEVIQFSDAFSTPGDLSYLMHDRSSGTQMAYTDVSWTCAPGGDDDAEYANASTTGFYTGRRGYSHIRAERFYINNVFNDCFIIPRTYHEQTLHYVGVPNRDNLGAQIFMDTVDADQVPETLVPPWGLIEDRMCQLLPWGNLGCLGDVNTSGATLGQVLAWDGTNWKPSSDIAADISNNSINDLADVETGENPPDSYVLTWDSAKKAWVASPKTDDIFDFDAIGIQPVTNELPIDRETVLFAEDSEQEINDNTMPRSDEIMDFGGSDDGNGGAGIRGVSFWAYNTQRIDSQIGLPGVRRFFLYGMASKRGGSTVLTSPQNTDYTSHIQLTPYFIRFGTSEGSLVGSEGVRLAQGFRLLYEDQSIEWEEFQSNEVPFKSAINDRIGEAVENINMSLYELEDLGNVQTTGKGQGYALTWDVTSGNWIASADVAANISLSSIGELNDVEKGDNTDLDTNDGWLSFDVGSMRSSRPWSEGGGLILESSESGRGGRYGWADDAPGQPEIRREEDGEISSMRWSKGGIEMDAPRSMKYNAIPALNDLSVPTWIQVQQQIVKQATDFTALFLMTGNDFLEKVYGWPVQVSMTTSPNPIYASQFADQYSYNFLKESQDSMTWTNSNGCPTQFNYQEPWSIEFFVFVDSTTPGDGYSEYIVAPTNQVNGPTIALLGSDRSKIWASVDTQFGNSLPSGTFYTADLEVNEWNHIYLCNEGAGRYRFFVNGLRVGSWSRSGSVSMSGGLVFGGRFVNSETYRTYFTGYLNNIRMTKTWVPYPVEQETIPVPTSPLEPTEGVFGYGTLNSLLDVDLVTNGPPYNGQVLMFNGVSDQWEPGPPDAIAYDISGNVINDLGDVNTENSVPDNDDILRWDGAANEWKRSKIDGNGGVRPLNARTPAAGVVPTAATLRQGELFLNQADKLLYALDNAGNAFAFADGDQLGKITRVVGGTF